MLNGKRIVVVLPAYEAEETLKITYEAIPRDTVDHILLVDDASTDKTVDLAQNLGISVYVHGSNKGYGANQKTCYTQALALGADVVVMLHPDYQYDPRLVTPMAGMVASEVYDVVLGSRILGSTALRGGMPLHKYLSNRFLTLIQNFLMGTKLSEFHTGYRAFSRKVLETIDWEKNANGFIFDNQMLAQVVAHGYRIGEISCPTRYFPEASSIGLKDSVIYGLGVIRTALLYRLRKQSFGSTHL